MFKRLVFFGNFYALKPELQLNRSSFSFLADIFIAITGMKYGKIGKYYKIQKKLTICVTATIGQNSINTPSHRPQNTVKKCSVS